MWPAPSSRRATSPGAAPPQHCQHFHRREPTPTPAPKTTAAGQQRHRLPPPLPPQPPRPRRRLPQHRHRPRPAASIFSASTAPQDVVDVIGFRSSSGWEEERRRVVVPSPQPPPPAAVAAVGSPVGGSRMREAAEAGKPRQRRRAYRRGLRSRPAPDLPPHSSRSYVVGLRPAASAPRSAARRHCRGRIVHRQGHHCRGPGGGVRSRLLRTAAKRVEGPRGAGRPVVLVILVVDRSDGRVQRRRSRTRELDAARHDPAALPRRAGSTAPRIPPLLYPSRSCRHERRQRHSISHSSSSLLLRGRPGSFSPEHVAHTFSSFPRPPAVA